MHTALILLIVCISKSLIASPPSKAVSSPSTATRPNNANTSRKQQQTVQRTSIHSNLKNKRNQQRQHPAYRHKVLVDKDHYNTVYGSKLAALQGQRRHPDIDYLKPGGSPWPWYEQAKLQYGDDKLLHSEQKREHKDYLAEYKKQFGENMRIYQESQRVNLETEREGKILDTKNGGKDNKSGKKNKRKKNDIFYEKNKDSKQFLV